MAPELPDILTPSEIALLRKEFAADPAGRAMRNAVTRVDVAEVALNRDVLSGTDPSVSHRLDTWTATDQKKSGRCWMFAGLNLLRAAATRQLGVKNFEFSQNYLMFYDKLERANYFLHAVAETADRDVDERTVAFLLDNAMGDGGQWDMFVALVEKHGLAPKQAMPETQSSSSSRRMNTILRSVLRRAAGALRAAAAADERDARRRAALQDIHRVLTIHLGTPPDQFLWQWIDDKGDFHRSGTMTPAEFAKAYVSEPLTDYICLVHDPRSTSRVGQTYTVEYLGNVVGARPVRYLNVPIEVMKDAARRTICDGQPVWFGCDYGKMVSRELGILDSELYDFEGVYGVSFTMTKAQRLDLHETRMTHAMLLTGVDLVDGRPRRWRVENSHGTDSGDRGFITMSDPWFDEYVFELAVRTSYLPPELVEAAQAEPVVLPPWDPMGALAGERCGD